MDIQKTDKESLATYVHRFKWEASGCKFNNDTATIRIFLKGLKNAHTIATKVYEKGPQTLTEAIKEVGKLQAAQQITSTLLPTSLVNTMSSNNDRCFQCQEVVIWHAIAPTYSATTVIIMDMLLWTAQIRYCRLVHQQAAGLALMTDAGNPPLDAIVTPDAHTMITRIDPDSVTPDLAPITTDIGVVATRDSHRSHSRSFHRPSCHSISCHRSSSSCCHCHDTPHCRPSSHRNISQEDSRSRHKSRNQHYRPA